MEAAEHYNHDEQDSKKVYLIYALNENLFVSRNKVTTHQISNIDIYVPKIDFGLVAA